MNPPSSSSSSSSSATSNPSLADFIAKQNIEGMTDDMIKFLVAMDEHMQKHYNETMLKRRAMANYEYREKVKRELKELEKKGLLFTEIEEEADESKDKDGGCEDAQSNAPEAKTPKNYNEL